MNALIPAAMARRLMASMLAKNPGDGRYAATAVMVVRLIACPWPHGSPVHITGYRAHLRDKYSEM
jgi:hypothetical protein